MDPIGTELGSPLWALWTIPLSAVLMVGATVLYARIAGLRSFSKMTTFDFAITVAMGSVIGAVVVSTASTYSVGNGVLALAALFLTQAGLAFVRSRSGTGRDVVDNTPLLLVRQGGELLHDNLRAARINPRDVYAKLRQANVTRLSDVHAVVLEPTGDISVLHGDGDLDPALLDGVRDQA